MRKHVTDMRGIVTVLNTPFRDDGALDTNALAAHAAYAAESGVAGFLVPGLAAEVEYLTPGERDAMVAAVVQAARGLPVIGGLAATDEEAALGRRLLELGCAGLLVHAADRSEETLLTALLELDALNPGFLMLQDWAPSGDGLPVDVMARLVEQVPSLRWLKIEVVPAGPKYTRALEATAGRVRVAGGWAVMQMIEALDRGVHAFMPTALHATYVRIYRLHIEGRRDESRELFDRVLPILAFSNQRLDISVAFFKRLLHAQGIYPSAHTRMPSAVLDAAQARIADELIERAIALETESAEAARLADREHP